MSGSLVNGKMNRGLFLRSLPTFLVGTVASSLHETKENRKSFEQIIADARQSIQRDSRLSDFRIELTDYSEA